MGTRRINVCKIIEWHVGVIIFEKEREKVGNDDKEKKTPKTNSREITKHNNSLDSGFGIFFSFSYFF